MRTIGNANTWALFICRIITCPGLLCMYLCSQSPCLIIYKTRFYFVFHFFVRHRNSFATQRPYELDESCAMFGNAHFDVLKKTVFYIHGYLEGPNHESVNIIVDSYLQRNDHNILVLDWSQLSNGNYLIDAVPNAKQVLLRFALLLTFITLYCAVK